MNRTRDLLNLDAARQQHELASLAERSGASRWAPVCGGALLAAAGLSRRSFGGTLLALAGGGLAYLGYTGRIPLGTMTAPDGESSLRVEESIAIARPTAEVYAEWRDVERLPASMSHLISVRQTAAGLSHWVARGPAGRIVEWDAEVIHDHESRIIAWRSVGNADVHNVGSVRFDDAPHGRGTELKVTLEYTPPGGRLGAAIARLLGAEPGQQIADDLRRFKQHIESGEPSTNGEQSHGGGRESRMDAGLPREHWE
ncbi:MAG TPA: SRPBCC family protein [Thermomicrobiales bacterium]|nr:SRPBCC family protein [Thermomicrobiales bacterium]